MQKILIVEDEELLVKALKKKLEKEAFEIFVARDGIEGLDATKAHAPDLILLDIVMPRMDGITMLAKMRKEDWGKDIPVIILTNLSSDEKMAESEAQGVNQYLVKTNWGIDEIIEKIKDKLDS